MHAHRPKGDQSCREVAYPGQTYQEAHEGRYCEWLIRFEYSCENLLLYSILKRQDGVVAANVVSEHLKAGKRTLSAFMGMVWKSGFASQLIPDFQITITKKG